MNSIRKILLPLLIIPFGMLIYVLIYPNLQWESTGLEYLFVAIGIPILIINFIAWFQPEIFKAYFPVKDDWGQDREKSILFAMLVSTLIAFTCVGVGGISAAANGRLQQTIASSGVQPITATAFARSVHLVSSATDPGLIAVPSTPRPSLEVSLTPELTPQIPVSGGVSGSSPTLPASPPAGLVTQSTLSATQSLFSAAQSPLPVTQLATQMTGASTVTQPAGAVAPAANCTSAATEYLDAIWEEVQAVDPANDVVTGWMVQSNAASGLWFVAAKIETSETEATLPGVWALLQDSQGGLEIYSINDIAMVFSAAAWGEDREPALTMQSNGAQSAYDCAAQAQ